ncbi:MAG: hypothetical protein A2Y38_24575 [Spirochaetes bacterium GWB1_59_5]|nr:MAG: hypothetical protein A2Y38_24575 [Spirochaetes bacterium GWB1_59_5]
MSIDPNTGDVLLTTVEAASFLRVHKRTLWRWTKEGKVPASTIPGTSRLIFRQHDLEKLLQPKSLAP